MSEDSRPLRFGILGAAKIAPKALVRPAAKIASAEITRVAARDRSRAEAFAEKHDIASVSDTYAELIEADDVDVVYNPLPMSLHAEWTIAALRAGKHVLCEKPFASNAAEAAEMVQVADEEGLLLGEAFHYWYHPMFQLVLEAVGDGRIGAIERVDAVFEVPVPKPDLRWSYDTSGGSLMDLGCYPMSWVRHVTGEEPTVVSATAVEDPPKVDAEMTTELSFGSGATASVSCALTKGPKSVLTVTGTEGTIEAVNPLAPQNGNRLTITTAHGQTSSEVDAGSTYDHMVRAFVEYVVHGSPFPTRGDDSINNMAAIDAVYTAAGLPVRGA